MLCAAVPAHAAVGGGHYYLEPPALPIQLGRCARNRRWTGAMLLHTQPEAKPHQVQRPLEQGLPQSLLG